MNKYCMHVIFKELLFFISFAALQLSSNSASTRAGEGVVKKIADI